MEYISNFVLIAEAVQHKIKVVMHHWLHNLSGDGMNDILFPAFFFLRGLKVEMSIVETDDMDQFVRRDIKHQGRKLDKGVCPFHGIQNPVVLQADPVKEKAFRDTLMIVFLIPVTAEMSKGAFFNFMRFQLNQGSDIVPVRPECVLP